MRTRFCLIVWLGLAAAGVAMAAEEKAPQVGDLTWLAGVWKYENAKRSVTEIWMQPDGGLMLGMSRTVAGGAAIEHEFMSIRQSKDGPIVLQAMPSGQPAATFALISSKAREVVFENPHHDFPQRIMYRLNSDGSLLAVIEGRSGDRTRRIEFPYQRAD